MECPELHTQHIIQTNKKSAGFRLSGRFFDSAFLHVLPELVPLLAGSDSFGSLHYDLTEIPLRKFPDLFIELYIENSDILILSADEIGRAHV